MNDQNDSIAWELKLRSRENRRRRLREPVKLAFPRRQAHWEEQPAPPPAGRTDGSGREPPATA
jgi:hypothetical protein